MAIFLVCSLFLLLVLGVPVAFALGLVGLATVVLFDVTFDPTAPGEEDILAIVPLKDEALSVSAVWGKAFVDDGQTYGHVLDPRTGWPVRGGLASVTVLASRCLVAGSASTLALLQGADGPAWLDELGLPHVRQRHDAPPEVFLDRPAAASPAPSPAALRHVR